MKIGTLLNNDVVTAGPRQSLSHVAQLMHTHHVGTVVITEQGRPVGIITDRDLALALAVHDTPLTASAQAVMTCPITTMNSGETILDATRHMKEHGVRRVPVVDDVGRAVGVVSADDLILLVARELGNLARAIEPEVAGVQ